MGYSRKPSGEVSRAADAIGRALFKLKGEKKGLKQDVVVPASDVLDKMYPSLLKIHQDLQNIGL
ncbi:hypothetical protein ES703_79260 [subsurface metagenome]